jgi:hypothetical protein
MAIKPQNLRGRGPRGAKLFANRSGRVANPFDCASQLVFGYAKMQRPIFNMILMRDNDFAAVGSDYSTDHVLRAYLFQERADLGFVPPH